MTVGHSTGIDRILPQQNANNGKRNARIALKSEIILLAIPAEMLKEILKEKKPHLPVFPICIL